MFREEVEAKHWEILHCLYGCWWSRVSFHYWFVLYSQFPSIETARWGKCPALCRWVGDENLGVMQREMVANRWAHCFCWQTRCLVGAWVGKSVSPPPLSSTIVICSTLSDSHTADHMRWVGIMRGLQLNWPWMAKNVRNAADTRGVVSVRGEAEGKVAFYWLHHYLSIAKKKVHQLTLQTLTSLPVSVPSSWLISQHSRQAGN